MLCHFTTHIHGFDILCDFTSSFSVRFYYCVFYALLQARICCDFTTYCARDFRDCCGMTPKKKMKINKALSFAIQDSGRGESSGATRNKLPICPEWTFFPPFFCAAIISLVRKGPDRASFCYCSLFPFFIRRGVTLSLFLCVYVDFRENVNLIGV